MNTERTIVSAMNPRRAEGDVRVLLDVWFEEIGGPYKFIATPFDPVMHGRELWIRAMAGEYGKVEELAEPPLPVIYGLDGALLEPPKVMKLVGPR